MKSELRPRGWRTFALSCLLVSSQVAFAPLLTASREGSRLAPGSGEGSRRIPHQSKPPQDRITLYKKFLLGPDPKPEKSEERRIAILSLVRNPDPRAHAVLQEVLALAGNTVRVPASTLEKICEALTEQEILDLGTHPVEDPNPGSAKKLEIYRSYVPVMIALRAKKVGERPSVLSSIRRFFLLLPARVRREVLERELTNKDPKLLAAAVRISGFTRDPRLAPALAPLLNREDQKRIVQESLARLTLRDQLFENEKDFQGWWKTHKGKTYEDLAEEALLSRLHRRRQVEEQFHRKAMSLAGSAVKLGLRVRPLPWEAFDSLLNQVEDPGDRASLGKSLFEGLRQLSRKSGVRPPWRPNDSGLNDFFSFARQEFQASSDPQQKGTWLSLATLLGKAMGGKPSQWARSTLEGLLEEKEPFDLGTTLDLLTFFPVDDAREAILKWIERKMSKDLPQINRWDSVGLAIDVLGRMGAPEDRVLLKGIRELSLSLVRKKGVPMKLREAALDLGGKLDGPGVLEGFQPIVLADSDQIPASLRMRAFGWVETLGTSLLQAEKDPSSLSAAERILAFFFRCLGDPEPRLREQVCKALENFPPSPKNFPEPKRREWGGRILGQVGKRLRVETEGHVIEALRRVFLHAGADNLLGATVLEHYVGVLLHWGEKRRGDYEKLLPAFLEDLRQVLKKRGIPPKTLVAFARSLNSAGLKRPAAVILDAPALVALDGGAGTLPENRRGEALRVRKERAALLLALLLEDGFPSDGKPGKNPGKRDDEVKRILGARNGLLDLGPENPMAFFYLAWAELMGGDASEAEKLLTRFRASKPSPSPKALALAVLLQARALLKLGKPKAVASLLAQRKDLEGMLLLLEARKAIGDHLGVVSLIQRLLQDPNFPSSGPRNIDLLLDLAEAQLAMKDLKGCQETLRSLPLLGRPSSKSRLKLLRSQVEALKKTLETQRKKKGAKKTSSKKGASKENQPKKPPSKSPGPSGGGAPGKGAGSKAPARGPSKTKKGSN